MGSVGGPSDVPRRYHLFNPHSLLRPKSLRSAQLAAHWPSQFPAGPIVCRGWDHGTFAVSQPVPANASDAAVAVVRRDRWSALFVDFDAAGPWRMHYLGAGYARAAVRRRSATP